MRFWIMVRPSLPPNTLKLEMRPSEGANPERTSHAK
jgi:hypothetical protein